MFGFQIADGCHGFHALLQQLNQLAVQFIQGAAEIGQLGQSLGVCRELVAHFQPFQQAHQGGGRELLVGVAEGFFGGGMHFNHQPVQLQVHGGLGHLFHQVALAGDVAGVAHNGHVGHPGTQGKTEFPLGVVSEGIWPVGVKSAVHRSQVANPYFVQAFQCANPQAHVGMDGVFDPDGQVHPAQGLGNFLHVERVDGGPSANPHGIQACFQTRLNVLGVGYFGHNGQSRCGAGGYQPVQSGSANSLEGTGAGTRFPNPCTESTHAAAGRQGLGRLQHLHFAFCAARSGYHQGPSCFRFPRQWSHDSKVRPRAVSKRFGGDLPGALLVHKGASCKLTKVKFSLLVRFVPLYHGGKVAATG